MDTPQKLAADISARFRLSDAEIARRVSSTQPTIWRLRTGKSKSCADTLYRDLCRLRQLLDEGIGQTEVRPHEVASLGPADRMAAVEGV